MGAVVSKAFNGIGSALGNAFVAPIKTIFGRSCEGICSGTWDLICFIEHLCFSSLLKLFVVSVLAYIILLFFYLLFKVGIIQCIGRSFCQITGAACKTYWNAMEEVSCFLWHKLRNTKRVYRHRFEDIEGEFSLSDEDSSSEDFESIGVNKRKTVRDRRRDQLKHSLYPRRHSSKRRHGSGRSHVRFKTREVSLHVKGSGRRKTGQIHLRSKDLNIDPKLFKKQRRR